MSGKAKTVYRVETRDGLQADFETRESAQAYCDRLLAERGETAYGIEWPAPKQVAWPFDKSAVFGSKKVEK